MNTTINYLQIAEVQLSYSIDQTKERARINISYDAVEMFRGVFENFMQHHEEFWIMLLSGSSRVLGLQKISQGCLSETLVDLRFVMQGAILANASSIIACHNHPSGLLYPSSQDDKLTERIKEACKIFSIRFLDHVILSEESHYSYADEGRL